MADDVGRHVHVTGSVQGVFFRAWAQGHARELGSAAGFAIAPTVRSRPISPGMSKPSRE